MRLYHVKNVYGDNGRRGWLSKLADKKGTICIWFNGNNVSYHVDKSGCIISRAEEIVNPDAVVIDAETATEKVIASAKKKAAMRAGLRETEETAGALLSKEELTPTERQQLLSCVNIAFHNPPSKIEGIFSIDSCAACDFCQRMMKAAENNDLMICGACYAARDAWKEAAWRHHKLNMRILSSVLFSIDELKGLSIDGLLCRMNEDGDTVNQTMGQNYLRIFAGHPETHFSYFYKNAPSVEAALHAEGIHTRDALPENVRFIHSSALIGFPCASLWFDDARFTVYPDGETTAAAIAAGAFECNGRKCRDCGFNCYLMQRHETVIDIAEVLRAPAARAIAIRAAYDAKRAQDAGRM